MALQVSTGSSIRGWWGSTAAWQQLIVDQSHRDQLQNHFCIILRCGEIKGSWFCTLKGQNIWQALSPNQTNHTNALPSLFIQEALSVFFPSSMCIIHYHTWRRQLFQLGRHVWGDGCFMLSTELLQLGVLGPFVIIVCHEGTAVQYILLIHMHPRSHTETKTYTHA